MGAQGIRAGLERPNHHQRLRFFADAKWWGRVLLLVLLVDVAYSQARDLEEDIEEAWETTGGDVVSKLVFDLENGGIAAGRKLIKFLRSNDYRIIRIQLSNEARGKQLQFSRTKGYLSVLKMLKQQNLESRAIAAEVIHLLVTENNAMAQMFGLHAWLPGSADVSDLLKMVEAGYAHNADEDNIVAAEEAAHAVWALMMSNADNLEMTHDRKGAGVFGDALLNSKSPRLKMWSAACLKRLLADFYATPDGTYASSARKTSDNDRLRQSFMQNDRLLKVLVQMITEGKVTSDLRRSQWPTHIEIEGRQEPWIQAWAAAGALGTFAMSEKNHDVIKQAGAVKALCELKLSPCALERVEAERALAELDEECLQEDNEEEDWGKKEF